MKEGPTIANIAALIGDPARANILMALMDGRALSVSELARCAGVTIQTTSNHLSQLKAGNLLTAEKQGRHRYFRLSSNQVAHALESLMGLAQIAGAKRFRTGPKDEALREARLCYDHLAGTQGVMLFESLLKHCFIEGKQNPSITRKGEIFFTKWGINIGELKQKKRPLCRTCLDWSERRHHLSGALGAAILDHFVAQKWIKPVSDSRALIFSPSGRQQFQKLFDHHPFSN